MNGLRRCKQNGSTEEKSIESKTRQKAFQPLEAQRSHARKMPEVR